MHNYSIGLGRDKYVVLEHNEEFGEPNKVVFTSVDENLAKTIYRGLKRGAGFSGWTPNFLLT